MSPVESAAAGADQVSEGAVMPHEHVGEGAVVLYEDGVGRGRRAAEVGKGRRREGGKWKIGRAHV